MDLRGLVMQSMLKETRMKNSTKEKSIDHILYSTKNKMKLLKAGRDWGPKNQNKDNLKSEWMFVRPPMGVV
jgi:hypothetical protein